MATRSEEEKRRINFYKIVTLFVDIVANTKRALLEHHLASARTTLPTFIDQHKHELLHMCYGNKLCTQRNPRCTLRKMNGFNETLLEKMFTKLDTLYNRRDEHNVDVRFITKENVSVNDLDITILRILLVNFCSETLWANCLSDNSITLYDLLTEHKHDLYHLWESDDCCCCDGNYALPSTPNKIMKKDWCALYPKENTPPCANAIFFGKADDIRVCVRKPERTITPKDLHTMRLSSLILNRYCSLTKAIEKLAKSRNNVFAHAVKAEMEDKEFDTIFNKTYKDILTIAKVCNKENETRDMLIALKNNPLTISESQRNIYRTLVLNELENLEFLEEILQEFQKCSQMTGKSINSIAEDIRYIRECVDSRYKKMFEMLRSIGCELTLNWGIYQAGDFKREANTQLDRNDPPTKLQSKKDTDTVDDRKEEKDLFICGGCQTKYRNLNTFFEHIKDESKPCRKQTAGNESGGKQVDGQHNTVRLTVSILNNKKKNNEEIPRPDEVSTEDAKVYLITTGSLILWIELATRLFESTDSFLEGIDQLLTNLFAKSVQEETEPISVRLFLTMVDIHDVSTYTKEDKLICGVCEKVHGTMYDFLRHKNKICKGSFDMDLETRMYTSKKVSEFQSKIPSVPVIVASTPEKDPLFEERERLLEICKSLLGNPYRKDLIKWNLIPLRPLTIAVIGPPRCGKSSFLNTIFASLKPHNNFWEELAPIGDLPFKGDNETHITWYLKRYEKKSYYKERDNYTMPTFLDMSGFGNIQSTQNETLLDLLFGGKIDVENTTGEVLNYGIQHGVPAMREKYHQEMIEKIDRIIVVCPSNPQKPLPINLLQNIQKVARKRDIATYGVFTHADKNDSYGPKHALQEREDQFIGLLGIPRWRFASITNYCLDAVPSLTDHICIVPTLDVPVLRLLKQVFTLRPDEKMGIDYTELILLIVKFLPFIALFFWVIWEVYIQRP
ncbi:uncharacterized protein LOC143079894 [Mytilus galloprovincialis]|uniref:uncharacterized protein LOC143079894 n=1 Tax=Mytilus galloprovincialis TaxID=29158 RepID=UPI003F7BE718